MEACTDTWPMLCMGFKKVATWWMHFVCFLLHADMLIASHWLPPDQCSLHLNIVQFYAILFLPCSMLTFWFPPVDWLLSIPGYKLLLRLPLPELFSICFSSCDLWPRWNDCKKFTICIFQNHSFMNRNSYFCSFWWWKLASHYSSVSLVHTILRHPPGFYTVTVAYTVMCDLLMSRPSYDTTWEEIPD